jgi:hypothetical protein
MNLCRIGLHKWIGNNRAQKCLRCDKKEINYWGHFYRINDTARSLDLFESFMKFPEEAKS